MILTTPNIAVSQEWSEFIKAPCEQHDISDINIAPNPADDNLKITINNQIVGEFELKIVNQNGKEVFRSKQLKNFPSFETDLNIKEFSEGTYIISIYYGNRIIKSEKFIKQVK